MNAIKVKTFHDKLIVATSFHLKIEFLSTWIKTNFYHSLAPETTLSAFLPSYYASEGKFFYGKLIFKHEASHFILIFFHPQRLHMAAMLNAFWRKTCNSAAYPWL